MILLKQFYFVLCILFALLIGYCFGRLNYSTIPCLKGPDYWCLNETTELLCDINNKSIGLCGYTNKRCQIKTGNDFCKSSPSSHEQSPLEYNGGLTGVNDNYFAYYILSLYWPPSSCPLVYNETNDLLRYFCSPYTNLNQPASERLVLHGLWPTFSTNGNYQGWPQYCSTDIINWSYCHINGNLCPWKNTSLHDFTQSHYELCLSTENIQQCIVNEKAILEPQKERLKILAPGYLNKYNLFINHEWTKHGSCCSSSFGNNISNYLNTMLDLTDTLTQPGSLTYESIQRYAGEKIGLNYLLSLLNETAIISCNSKCQLEELWLCMSRDHRTGLPSKLMTCPLGARNTSDSCKKARCEYVFIPLRNKTQINYHHHHHHHYYYFYHYHNNHENILFKYAKLFLCVILFVIIINVLLYFCTRCCTLIFSY